MPHCLLPRPKARRGVAALVGGLCLLLAGLLGTLPARADAAAATLLQRWEAFAAVRGHTVATGEQGRALRHTTTMAEDAAGRIWIGDYAGLTRLDGDLMHRYTPADVPAMAEGYIHHLLPLPDGDLLVGGDREGLLHWQADSDTFAVVALADGRRLTRINGLVPAREGGFWVAADQGLFHLDGSLGRLTPVPAQGREAAASHRVLGVHEMADGTLWLAAQPGLYRRAPGAATWEPVVLADAGLQARLRDEPAWTLASDGQGRLWVGLVRSGVVVLDAAGRAQAPAGLDGLAGLHAGTTVRSLLWDASRQRMLVGTDGQGLLVVEGLRSRRLPVNLSVFTGGRNFHVRRLALGANGRIWAASDRGVFHFDPAPAAIVELDASLPGQDPYEVPATVRSVHVDGQGRLWLGQSSGVIQVLDPHAGTRRVIRLPPPLDSSAVVAMTDDGKGRVWAVGQGVTRIDMRTLAVQPGFAGGALPPRRYTGLAGDGRRMWLAHYEGLLELDLDGRVLRRMEDLSAGLLTTRLGPLAYRDDRLWVGSAEGVHALDLERWHARALEAAGDVQAMNRATASLLATADGLWAGNLGGAVYGRGEAPGVLAARLDTGGHEVRGLLDDAGAGIWLAVDDQAAPLRHLDRQGALRPVTVRHGLHPDVVFYRQASTRTAEGLLVLATDTGALLLDPVALETAPPSAVELSPQLFAVYVDGVPLPRNALPAAGRPLRLGHDVERLVVAFSALDYTGAQLRHYSYRLEGLDSRWNPVVGNEPMVFYSRLPPGQYTLLLRTTSEEFPGHDWITRIPLVVSPVWYQTGWSWLAIGLAVALAWSGLQRYRSRWVRRRQQRLEGMVAARTTALEQANARLARLASEDVLTGLLTRRRALENMADRHRRLLRDGGQDAVLLLDLDHFKQINDTHGHLAGDAVLREVGQRLRQTLREVDITARYGGEELLVVLPATDANQARQVAERLLQVLRAEPVLHKGVAIEVRASLGLSMMSPASGVERALANADRALYQAKAQGRDRMCQAPH